MASDKPLRLLLGFDYGTRQIGVAVGQAVTGQARELCVLKAQNGVPDWNRVEALIKEWQPDAIVVGLPLNMDGSPSEMSERAEKFGRRLNGRFNLPVFTHDERLTTYAAKGERLARASATATASDRWTPWPPPCCWKAGWPNTRIDPWQPARRRLPLCFRHRGRLPTAGSPGGHPIDVSEEPP